MTSLTHSCLPVHLHPSPRLPAHRCVLLHSRHRGHVCNYSWLLCRSFLLVRHHHLSPCLSTRRRIFNNILISLRHSSRRNFLIFPQLACNSTTFLRPSFRFFHSPLPLVPERPPSLPPVFPPSPSLPLFPFIKRVVRALVVPGLLCVPCYAPFPPFTCFHIFLISLLHYSIALLLIALSPLRHLHLLLSLHLSIYLYISGCVIPLMIQCLSLFLVTVFMLSLTFLCLYLPVSR